jgi:hypothetical protein
MYFVIVCSGFDSFVGEVVRVIKSDVLVDLKYGLCGTGYKRFWRCTFAPNMFYNLTRINLVQGLKLLKPFVHRSFDRSEMHRVIF